MPKMSKNVEIIGESILWTRKVPPDFVSKPEPCLELRCKVCGIEWKAIEKTLDESVELKCPNANCSAFQLPLPKGRGL